MPTTTTAINEALILNDRHYRKVKIILTNTNASLLTLSSSDKDWGNNGNCGVLMLIKERGLPNSPLLLILRSSMDVIWEHEVYVNFKIYLSNDNFLYFASDTCLFGLLFTSMAERDSFIDILCIKAKKSSCGPIIIEGSNKKFGVLNKNNGGGFFSSLFSSSRTRKIVPSDIGDPSSFEHLGHIGFNSTSGHFDIYNIPPELKTVFDKAGIKKDDLLDDKTASFIADFVEKNSELEDCPLESSVDITERRGAAAAPPPPPPPRRIIVKGAAAPPPPPPPPPPIQPQQLSTESSTLPTNSDPMRSMLLESIRNANASKILKHRNEHDELPIPPKTEGNGDQSDLMANMLASALAMRNRRVAHSESDGDDDSDW